MKDTVWKEKYSYSARWRIFKEKLRARIERIKNIQSISELKDYLKISPAELKAFIKDFGKPLKYLITSSLLILILIPIATYIYFIQDLSTKDRIINKKNEGVVLLDREGKPFFNLFEARTKTTVSISDIPKVTQQAFIAVEDRDFYNHPGFSINGILRAIKTNVTEEEFAAGGSTISQQLIKNTILSQSKTLFRKYQELVLAIEIERKYSKDDILELYLNTTYFGEGAFGIEEASQRYFSKKTSELTVAESALLAAIIRAPSYYSPISGDTEEAIDRAKLVLKLMTDQGYISETQYQQALKEDIKLNPSVEEDKSIAIHFALMVRDQLIDKYGEQKVAQSGFVVKTTLDSDLQEVAQNAVANQVIRLARNKVSNGAAVAIDPITGEVLALVGSHDWNDEKNGKINMAVSPRQPGSSFKPIIYAKAIEDRIITAATVLPDKKVNFGSYIPKNYDGKYRNEILTRFALANSLNIPAVHVMNMVGVNRGVAFAKKMGITSFDDKQDYGLALVLGSAEIPLVEMTNAYAAFADKGLLNKYKLFTQIIDKNGKVIYEPKQSPKEVLSAGTAYIISSILSDIEARKEVFGSSLNLSREAAVKTGTTNDYKDALTIGYTPQIVVGTWVGNNDATPMDSVAGSLGAAPVFRQIMESYLRGKPTEKFRRPSEILPLSVCRNNGLKAEVATASAYTEFFLRGTLPLQSCTKATPTDAPEPTIFVEEATPTEIPTPTPIIEEATPTPSSSSGIINFSQ